MSSKGPVSANFLSIIDMIVKKKCTNKNEMLDFLVQSSQYSEMVNGIVDLIRVTTDPSTKVMIFSILIDILSMKEHVSSCFDPKTHSSVLRAIVDFPFELSESAFYDRIKKCLILLFEQVTEANAKSYIVSLTEPKGLLSMYAISVLSIVRNEIKGEIFEKIQTQLDHHVPSTIFALTLFLNEFKYSQLSEGEKEKVDDFGSPKLLEFVKVLLSGDGFSQKMAFYVISSMFSFYPSDVSVPAFMSISANVIALLHKAPEKIKLEIVQCISQLPHQCPENITTPEVQLRTYLKDMSEHLDSYESPYANAIISFVKPRSSVDSFNEIIEELFKLPSTTRAAILVSTVTNLFATKPSILGLAFPPVLLSPSRSLVSIEVLSLLQRFDALSKEVLSAFSKCAFLMMSNPSRVNDPSLKPGLFCMIKPLVACFKIIPDAFCSCIMEFLPSVNDKELLSCISAEIVTFVHSNPTIVVSDVDPQEYSKFFLVMFLNCLSVPETLRVFSGIIHIFKPSQVDTPKDYVSLVDSLIPNNVTVPLCAFLVSHSKKYPPLCAVCSAFPCLSDEDIKSIVEIVIITPLSQKDDHKVNAPLFLDSFAALSARYLPATLDKLEQLSNEKEKGSFLFFGKKKQKFSRSIRRVIILAITNIILNCKLNPDQQSKAYKIIYLTLPEPDNIKKYAAQADLLINAIPQLKDAEAPIQLIEKVIGIPLFVECIPQLIKEQKGLSKYVDDLAQSWVFHLCVHSVARSRNLEISDLLLRMSPHLKTLSIMINAAANKFGESDPLPFIDFVMQASISAKKVNINIETGILTEFFVKAAPLCLSNLQEIRAATYTAMINLFSITSAFEKGDPIKEIGKNISQIEVINSTIRLFTKCCSVTNLDFSKQLLEMIILHPVISLASVIILRAISEVHSENILQTSQKSILQIFDNASKLSGITAYHAQSAFLSFANQDMAGFISILISSTNVQYKRAILIELLQKENRRAIFLEKYTSLLSLSFSNSSFFQLLPAVIKSEETSEISTPSFACLLSSVIMWIVSIQSSSSAKSLYKASKEDIEFCLSFLFSRPPTPVSLPADLKFVSQDDLMNLLRILAASISSISHERIQKVCTILANFIGGSNEPLRLAIGVIFINLIAEFGSSNNSVMNSIITNLLICISNIFNSSNDQSRRVLSSVLSSRLVNSHFDQLKPKEACQMFKALLECLNNKDSSNRIEIVASMTRILSKVPQESLNELSSLYLASLRRAVESVPFSIDLLELLESYIAIKADIREFSMNIKLNLVFLLEQSNHERVDIRQRVTLIMQKLLRSLGNEPQKNMKSIFDERELAVFANECIKKITISCINPILFILISTFVDALSTSNLVETSTFRTACLNLALELCQIQGEMKENSFSLLRKLIP